MKKLRVLLAEDHATVREGLRMLVNAQPDMEVIGEAENGQVAVAQAQRLLPDVVVMDVSMPIVNGLQATETLRGTCPQVKVVMLTRHADSAYLKQLLRAGACGYVLKQSRSADLLHGIRAAASGGKYVDPSMAADLMDDYGGTARPLPGRSAVLSPREKDVLRMVASGYSNKEIGAALDISVKTVETHKANAMHKLGIKSRIDVVRFAVLQGWLEDP